MKEIALLHSTLKTIVDDEDYLLATQATWRAIKSRHVIYAGHQIQEKSGRRPFFWLHRIIIGALPNQIVDHINGDGLDNRRLNLRLCTIKENVRHRRLRIMGVSRYRGVWLDPRYNSWTAYIKVDLKRLHLGTFKTEEEAARAFDRAAIAYFGSFHGALNFSNSEEGE